MKKETKKKIIDFLFVEISWKDIPRILASFVLALLLVIIMFAVITKIAMHFHL